MKQASADGLRNKTKKPDKEGITEEEENTFWEKNLLGSQTAKSLLHTIYFYNGNLFGIRSNEHRNLRYINLRVESTVPLRINLTLPVAVVLRLACG